MMGQKSTSEIISRVKQIEIKTNRSVEGNISGAYLSAFKGTGIEFSEVREYQPGDDPRTIDWNVTARMNYPFVKEFIEERDLTIVIVFDISRSSEFTSTGSLKKDIGIELCASLALSAIRNNDLVGLMLTSDIVEKYIPPMKGKRHALRIIRDAIFHEPVHDRTDLSVPLVKLSRILKKKSVIFIISDFQNDPISLKKPLQMLNIRHEIIAIRLWDMREQELPGIGLIEIEDEETGEQVLVDTANEGFRVRFKEIAESRNRKLSEVTGTLKIDLVEISTAEDWIKPILKFFKMRERR